MLSKENIAEYFRTLQNSICQAIENTDGKGKFREDLWQHHSGGGGRTRVITDGNIIAKGGVNFSAVSGEVSDALQKQLKITEKTNYFATGVSIVQHPVSPMVPIIHMNVRYFEMANGICWFGGGIDLTPHYVVEEDACWFHQQLKAACDKHSPAYYPKYKEWADNYFFIPHRNETRGIGGIFFDYLKPNEEIPKEDLFTFVKSVGESFAPIYTHLMAKNNHLPYGEAESNWQMLRRGRYVEFNLVWDRGTKFGLETNGRTESILMSLPPVANWEYGYRPEAGSPEEKTLGLLKKGIEWV
ncbi:oxygen-dependent coproporphyrinogen oxidase [Emticicia sp. BO119]|uniref:oxygen-dependent coproporphyrinogen oxidase n=1 Tax=Emticicia sp. BO119 TaxID=2757768 RepID=UPI0015F03AC1|nr:oxygen-dependent coproporphyrinogen oxidase [Emticicia sp. BO119]MBA4852213.1 oxygen-dependent coproporphyrinogen oxidase [Emticicia sp. BO119]